MWKTGARIFRVFIKPFISELYIYFIRFEIKIGCVFVVSIWRFESLEYSWKTQEEILYNNKITQIPLFAHCCPFGNIRWFYLNSAVDSATQRSKRSSNIWTFCSATTRRLELRILRFDIAFASLRCCARWLSGFTYILKSRRNLKHFTEPILPLPLVPPNVNQLITKPTKITFLQRVRWQTSEFS